MFSKLKVSTRLALLVGLAMVGLLVFGAYGLMQLKQTMLEDKKVKLKNVVELAIGLADSYKAQADAGRMTMDDAKKATAEAWSKLRYSQTEYFFGTDANGLYVASLRSELIGKANWVR